MKYLVIILFLTFQLLAFEIEKSSVYKNQSVKGWIMSEKLDGIRAIWDGQELRTKNGNIIVVPKEFINNFPPFYLDGELWTKRNDFETVQSIVLDKTASISWNQITYNIFEVPYEKGYFLQRLQKAKNWFKSHPNSHIRFIPQISCKNKEHLEQFLQEIIELKGEGVIIKNPNYEYISKRSKYSLKVKKFLDMEGKVIAINYDNQGNMKSLQLLLKNGITFNLGGGFTQKERLNHPKIDDIVTFKYYGLSKNGKPKFASFLRIRQKE